MRHKAVWTMDSGHYGLTEELPRAPAKARRHDLQPHRAWLEEVREKVRVGLEQADRGELLDAEEVFERIAQRVDGLRARGA
jgi:hypothetical protein